jgi:hypothetical protein
VRKLLAALSIATAVALGGAQAVDACRAFPEILEYQVGHWLVSSGCISWTCNGGCSLYTSVEYNTYTGEVHVYYY